MSPASLPRLSQATAGSGGAAAATGFGMVEQKFSWTGQKQQVEAEEPTTAMLKSKARYHAKPRYA